MLIYDQTLYVYIIYVKKISKVYPLRTENKKKNEDENMFYFLGTKIKLRCIFMDQKLI